MKSQKRIQLKPHLTIANIGVMQFWTGFFLGVINALVFYFFTFYLVDFMIVFNVSMNGDLPLQTKNVSFFETSFLTATSICLGITMMIRHWFMQPTFHFIGTYKNISLRISNFSLFIFYLALYVAVVYIRFFMFGKSFTGVHQPINYTSFFFLIPLYLFFVAWTEVSRYFIVYKWMTSAFLLVLFSVILINSLQIQPAKFSETAFKMMHSEELNYIDTELKKAKEHYQLTFSEETRNALKELRTERAFELLKKTRLAFKTNGNVSLDTIILEKILLHNFKGYYKDSQKSYQYVLPFQMYEQLRKVDSNSPEATELLNILSEFFELSLYFSNVFDNEQQSTLHYIKKTTMEEANSYLNFSYDNVKYNRMYDETFYLLYHLQRLGTYNHHPLFEISFPFPPPSILNDSLIHEHFPELKNTIE